MKTDKPNVQRYTDIGSETICPSSNMHESDDGDYVLYEYRKTLQAVCDHYKNAIAEIATSHSVDRWANTSSDKELEQYLSDGIAQLEGEYRKQMEALQAECEKLRKAIRRLCNIYVVDDYYSGDIREEHLNRAVERAIDAAMEPTK